MKKKNRRKKRVFGTKERPRLSVFRSLNNIYAQLIDDTQGITLLGVSSLSFKFKGSKTKTGGKIAVAREIGVAFATKAKALGIKAVVFDRGTRQYHGRLKALAEAAREGGLLF
ncbi:MAG: 50S ribosomal protein L18 [Candidatus Saganbacteria bacterium]|nr:50S ribosomal protein L18 [Candidatus Saganbacteria bacterium]